MNKKHSFNLDIGQRAHITPNNRKALKKRLLEALEDYVNALVRYDLATHFTTKTTYYYVGTDGTTKHLNIDDAKAWRIKVVNTTPKGMDCVLEEDTNND